MRKIWIQVEPWNQEVVTAALECGADGLVIPDGCDSRVKALGRITTISADGDLKPGEDVVTATLRGQCDEEEIQRLSRHKKVVLETDDWTIIPLENLIARGVDVIARVDSVGEAQTAFGILEKGVRHILFRPENASQVRVLFDHLEQGTATVPLTPAEIVSVEAVGMGDRVCVDTCTNMSPGQGILCGNSSSALFLIHAESLENPYVNPRPFRVNAGAVHAYTRMADGGTRYLTELQAGDTVAIVDHEGRLSPGVVGRVKIEKRPMMLVTAAHQGRYVTTIVQNAETIRLTGPSGEAVSVVALAAGDQVLLALESGGRHFGMKIDGTITEK